MMQPGTGGHAASAGADERNCGRTNQDRGRGGGVKRRCAWINTDPLCGDYHDREWGVPLHDDRLLFEHLSLAGAQAGLSWMTVLRKRENYRAAFDRFDPARVARFGEGKIRKLLSNEGIIRNRLKILSVVRNAKALLAVQEEFGNFDAYIWGFVDGRPKTNAWKRVEEIPAKTAESEAMSRDLARRGFSFVGPTICYAFMQSVGMDNDHTVQCYRHAELARRGGRAARSKRRNMAP